MSLSIDRASNLRGLRWVGHAAAHVGREEMYKEFWWKIILKRRDLEGLGGYRITLR
jgi:hypothetical protein